MSWEKPLYLPLPNGKRWLRCVPTTLEVTETLLVAAVKEAQGRQLHIPSCVIDEVMKRTLAQLVDDDDYQCMAHMLKLGNTFNILTYGGSASQR